MTVKPNSPVQADEPHPATSDGQSAATPTVPGPDEAPANSPAPGRTPDPVQSPVPNPKPLTQGQLEGVSRDGLEAYMFGQRTRHDAAGRLWNMRREAVADRFQLKISVSYGDALLVEGGIPLDRLPSADGEHQLLILIESLAEQAHDAQAALHVAQQKLAKANP